jgi:hypothetical protein
VGDGLADPEAGVFALACWAAWNRVIASSRAFSASPCLTKSPACWAALRSAIALSTAAAAWDSSGVI